MPCGFNFNIKAAGFLIYIFIIIKKILNVIYYNIFFYIKINLKHIKKWVVLVLNKKQKKRKHQSQMNYNKNNKKNSKIKVIYQFKIKLTQILIKIM